MTSCWHWIRWETAQQSRVSVTPRLQLWQPRALMGPFIESAALKEEQAFVEDLAFPVKLRSLGAIQGRKAGGIWLYMSGAGKFQG